MSLSDSEYLWLETNTQVTYVRPLLYFKLHVHGTVFLAFHGSQTAGGILFFHPRHETVMNGTLYGRLLEINVNLFSLFLTLPQDTGIVTTATLLFIL